jgi:hypothetical protein
MTTEHVILHIFYLVATSLPAIPRHSQAKLYPSELVTMLSDKPSPWQISVFETRIAFQRTSKSARKELGMNGCVSKRSPPTNIHPQQL